MMRHIFGAAAIPLPPPVNQLQRDVGRASVEGRERAGRCGEAVLFNADSQTHTPSSSNLNTSPVFLTITVGL